MHIRKMMHSLLMMTHSLLMMTHSLLMMTQSLLIHPLRAPSAPNKFQTPYELPTNSESWISSRTCSRLPLYWVSMSFIGWCWILPNWKVFLMLDLLLSGSSTCSNCPMANSWSMARREKSFMKTGLLLILLKPSKNGRTGDYLLIS